jgi:hypothetical protein
MTQLPRSPGSTLVLWLNQEIILRLHLAILATMRPALDSAGHRVPRTKPTCLLHTWRPHRQQPFVLVLHLHQHPSSRNLHLQYLAKNQSTQCCQSLITLGNDHPPVLEPHMVLNLPLDECIDTHTHIEAREKKQIKETPTSNRKPRKGKKQDHLKKISLGPVRKVQRLDTSETTLCSSKEHNPQKQTRAPPAHKHTPPGQVPTLGTNRSGQFPKTVRSVPPNRSCRLPKSVRPTWYSRRPPKDKNAKEMCKLPLDSWDRF